MLYVIICELIPDSQEGEYSKLATFGVITRLFNNDDFMSESGSTQHNYDKAIIRLNNNKNNTKEN